MYMPTCLCVYRVSSSMSHQLIFLRQTFSLNPGFTNVGRLAVKQIPSILLPLLPQSCNYIHETQVSLPFYRWARDVNPALNPCVY